MEDQNCTLLYLSYDYFAGNRNWKALLDSGEIRAVDTEIAQTAMAAGESEKKVRQMIDFGSPHAQQLGSPEERNTYVAEIVSNVMLAQEMLLTDKPVLHMHSPASPRKPIEIKGNQEGIITLIQTLLDALAVGKSTGTEVFHADGEASEIKVLLANNWTAIAPLPYTNQ